MWNLRNVKLRFNIALLIAPAGINILFDYYKGGNFNIHIWCGSAFSSAKDGKSGFIYNLVKGKYAFWAAQTCVHFMKILTVYTLTSHVLTLKAHYHKMYVFVVH